MYVKYHFYLPRSVGNRHTVHQAIGLLVHPVDVHLGPLLQSVALGLLSPGLLHGRLVPVERQGREASGTAATTRRTGRARGGDENAPTRPAGGGTGHQTGLGQGEGGLPVIVATTCATSGSSSGATNQK